MASDTIPLRVTNVEDGETVHQRCLIVVGTCKLTTAEKSDIHMVTKGANRSEIFPKQTWSAAGGNFKAIIMLSPGVNILELVHVCDDGLEQTFEINVNYVPLLQYPPLYLAIMIASDSPCLIDGPPPKTSGLSSVHLNLDAAIAKLRMTAYMWQALIAEDIRLLGDGLGRRTFRLEEEWIADTVSREFLDAGSDKSHYREAAMQSTAKVHLIRSERTTQQIRDINMAEGNPSPYCQKNDLFDFFVDALKLAGGPLASDARPVVAGLILDSHYSSSEKLTLGNVAAGCHNPDGISLGMFGSHLTYSWPRCLEEVTACLTDTRNPGDTVGNFYYYHDTNPDRKGPCSSMWEACSIGQGALLHQVGHAFGRPHTAGIMEGHYAQDWPKNFLAKTEYCTYLQTEGVVVDDETLNYARWAPLDALAFRNLPHFRLPTDPFMTTEERNSTPLARAILKEQDAGEANVILDISSIGGIALIILNHEDEEGPCFTSPVLGVQYSESELEQRFDRTKPLHLHLFGVNGKDHIVSNVWALLARKNFVHIPGSSLCLSKRSVASTLHEEEDLEKMDWYEWAQLLREKGPDGALYRAVFIDLRIGMSWGGGVVNYADGHKSNWAPMRSKGRDFRFGEQEICFGGYASLKVDLPVGVDISYIEINRDIREDGEMRIYQEMRGVRIHLSNGTVAGELNNCGGSGSDITRLAPAPDEVIVGFYGRTLKAITTLGEFGIITAPKDVGIEGLSATVYDIPGLRNTAGMDETEEDNDLE